SGHGVSKRPLVGIPLLRVGIADCQHFNWLATHLVVRRLFHPAEGERHFGTDPEPEMIWRYNTGGKHFRWPSQPNQEFRTCHGQALAGANVKRFALPAPGIDFKPESRAI